MCVSSNRAPNGGARHAESPPHIAVKLHNYKCRGKRDPDHIIMSSPVAPYATGLRRTQQRVAETLQLPQPWGTARLRVYGLARPTGFTPPRGRWRTTDAHRRRRPPGRAAGPRGRRRQICLDVDEPHRSVTLPAARDRVRVSDALLQAVCGPARRHGRRPGRRDGGVGR